MPQQALELADRQRAAADFHQPSHQSPYHFPQEVRRAYSKEYQIAVHAEFHVLNHNQRRAFALHLLAEADEIVSTQDGLACLLHSSEIKLILHPPYVSLGKRSPSGRGLIEVVAAYRVVP